MQKLRSGGMYYRQAFSNTMNKSLLTKFFKPFSSLEIIAFKDRLEKQVEKDLVF